MICTALVVLVALVALAILRPARRALTGVGLAVLGVAIAAVAIAELTGNLFLYYLGSLSALVAVIVIAVRVGVAARGGGRTH